MQHFDQKKKQNHNIFVLFASLSFLTQYPNFALVRSVLKNITKIQPLAHDSFENKTQKVPNNRRFFLKTQSAILNYS